jgi:protein-S-isoprenylcysteine O-methyltransferase Ste14
MANPEHPGHHDPRTIPELMTDLVHELTALFKSEGRLVRAEISESGRKIATGGEMIAAGGIILLVALFVLVQALVIGLSEWVGPGWAALIVGVTLAIIGAVLVQSGRKSFSSASLTPDRTMQQLQQDMRLREKI